jgi:hypothetical protein
MRRSTNFTNSARRTWDDDNSWQMSLNIPIEERKWTERPTVVVVPGWPAYTQFRRSKFGGCCKALVEAFREHYDVNAVEVTWKNGLNKGYDTVVQAIEPLGRRISKWLNTQLGHNATLYKEMTLIGASLGGEKFDQID